jgi:hypothetical protein
MSESWRALNAAHYRKRRRKLVSDRTVDELVAEFLAKGGKITVCPAVWVGPKWSNTALGSNLPALNQHLRHINVRGERGI